MSTGSGFSRWIIRTLLGSEIAVGLSNVLVLSGGWVDDLDVRSEVPVTVDLRELIEGLVGNVRNIQLMVSD